MSGKLQAAGIGGKGVRRPRKIKKTNYLFPETSTHDQLGPQWLPGRGEKGKASIREKRGGFSTSASTRKELRIK